MGIEKVNNKKLSALHPDMREKIATLLKDIDENINVLYDLATRDEKTGLYNHRFFKTLFEMEFDKARRGKKLSLLIIDVDYFKKLNDKYGHLQGDKILEHLASLLKKHTRKYDIVARFGGEEFFILFPNTSLSIARRVSERIRKMTEKDKIMKKYHVTISGGLSCYNKKDSEKKMKERADKALYKAKENGRNRIEVL